MSYKLISLRALAIAAVVTIGVASASAASAANRSVMVINETNHTMTNLYASGINDPNFHGDWLGRDTLAPGESMVINFNDGTGACLVDVKAVFNDNTYVSQHGFNVCTQYRMTFTGN
jgi:hypothetical protein